MPLTLLDCAHWQQRVYDAPSSKNYLNNLWTYFVEQETEQSPWALGFKRDVVWGVNLLVLRGTTTQFDWYEDFRSQKAIVDGRLGAVPIGFDYGLDMAWGGLADVVTILRVPEPQKDSNKLVIVGHSLGAARATLLAGLLVYGKMVPAALVLFGCPRSGQERLRELVNQVPFRRSFRNLQDPVCEVPLDIPLFDPWEDVVGLEELSEAPIAGDRSILADHHIDLYVQGMAKRDEVVVA